MCVSYSSSPKMTVWQMAEQAKAQRGLPSCDVLGNVSEEERSNFLTLRVLLVLSPKHPNCSPGNVLSPPSSGFLQDFLIFLPFAELIIAVYRDHIWLTRVWGESILDFHLFLIVNSLKGA